MSLLIIFVGVALLGFWALRVVLMTVAKLVVGVVTFVTYTRPQTEEGEQIGYRMEEILDVAPRYPQPGIGFISRN